MLFARERTERTPESVTATALVEEGISPKTWTIIIAKNDGLDKPECVCAQLLMDWWGQDESPLDRDPGSDNEAWVYLEDFWSDRVRHYVKNVSKILPEVRFDDDDSWVQEALDIAKAIVPDERINQETPSLNHRSKKSQSQSIKHKIILPLDIFERCYSFRLQQSSRKTAHALTYRMGKIVYYIEMLGMLKSIWNSIVSFRKLLLRLEDQLDVCLGVLEAPAKSELKESGLYSTIGKWKAASNFMEETQKRALVSLMAGKKNGGNSQNDMPLGTFNEYFHCELQILNALWDNPGAHKYIGVSKLSCYLCWIVLNQQSCRFKSRGTHGQISANCQSPMSLRDTPKSLLGVFLDALLTTQAHMLAKINRAALGLGNSLGNLENQLQTQFGPSHHYSGELDTEAAVSTEEKSVTPPRRKWASRDPYVSDPINILHGSLAAIPDVQLQPATAEIVLSLSRSWFVRGEKFFLSFVDWPDKSWIPQFEPANDESAVTWGAVQYELEPQTPNQKETEGPDMVFLWFRFANVETLEVGDDIYLTAVDSRRPFHGRPWCDISTLEGYDWQPLLKEWSDAESRKALIRKTYEMKDEKASMVWARMESRKAGVLVWDRKMNDPDEECIYY